MSFPGAAAGSAKIAGTAKQVQAGRAGRAGPFQARFIAPRHRCLASGEVQWLRAEVPSFDVLRAPPPSFGVGGVWGVILGRGY